MIHRRECKNPGGFAYHNPDCKLFMTLLQFEKGYANM